MGDGCYGRDFASVLHNNTFQPWYAIMDMLGDTLDNVDRGCVYQPWVVLRHVEQAAEK